MTTCHLLYLFLWLASSFLRLAVWLWLARRTS